MNKVHFYHYYPVKSNVTHGVGEDHHHAAGHAGLARDSNLVQIYNMAELGT